MSLLRLYYFCILFFFATGSGKGQGSPVFINFTTRDGLASNETYRVLQDSAGYIWIATDFGLSRYDGYSFHNFGVADGMPENSVLNLFMDKKGKIWFNTFGASIGYIDHEKIFTIPMNAEWRKRITSPIPSSFYTSDGDTLYYSINNNDGYFKITNTTIERVLPQTKDSDMVCYFEKKDNGFIFFYKFLGQANSNALSMFYNDTLHPIMLSNKSQSIRAIANGDLLYVAMSNSLYRIDKDHQFVLKEEPKSITLAKIINGKFYLGKINCGLEIFDGDPFNSIPKTYLENLTITDVMTDRERGLWVTTLEHGIYYLPNPNISEVVFNSHAIEKAVSAMTSSSGKIIFGTYNGDLYEWDNEKIRKYPLTVKGNSRTILSLACDESTQSIVGGTYNNTFIIKDNKIVFSDDLSPAMFLKKDSGNKIWGGNSDYLFNIDHGKMTREKLTFTRSLRIFDVLPLDAHKMLAATIDGLYHIYPDDTLYKIHEQDTLNTIRFTCLEKIENNIIVAGTRGQGIVVLTGDKFFFINTSNNLADNCIQDLLIEGTDIYAGTNNGISKISFNTSEPRHYHIRNYSSNEGYLLNKITTLARMGEYIYAGTEEGLFYFNPDKVNLIDVSPEVAISEIIINNKIAGNDAKYELSYLENNISIKYISISPRSLGHISYLYRMLPEDKKWHSTIQREINFSSLNPGSYTFECIAKNSAGISSGSVASISFLVHEPWWKTWWFKTLLTLIIILAAYVIFRERFKRKYLEQQHELERVKTIEEERHRIAADMHDDLGTDLTNLVLTTERLARRTDVSQHELEKISGRASDLIDKLSQIIWAMNPAYDYLPNLTAYITRFVAKQGELNNLNFHVEKSEGIPPARVGASLRRNIFLILKEALNNSIKHGRATDIKLQFNFSAGILTISLKDNGIGFSTKDKMNAGNGISNLHKRARMIDADLTILSAPGDGTEIRVVVKIESAA